MRRARLSIIALALLGLLVIPASAEAGTPEISVTAKGGVNFFLNSQSIALEHMLKPMVRLEAAFRTHRRFSLAVELAASTSGGGYRLIGGYILGKFHLYDGDLFSMKFAAGGGLGTGARILATDLQVEAEVAAWMQAGLQFRWSIVKETFALGLDLISENVSSVGLSLAAEFQF